MREMMGEITKLIKENQPAPPTGPVDLDTDDATVLADPIGRRNVSQVEEGE